MAAAGPAADLQDKAEAAEMSAKEYGKVDAASLRAKYSDRIPINSILKLPGQGLELVGQTIRVGGWVKTGREQGKGEFAFLELNDGSCPANLQVVVKKAVGALARLVPTGTCVQLDGQMIEPPAGTKQRAELHATAVVHVGESNASEYPLAGKKLSLEYLREKMHLRVRSNTISAVTRVRNELAFAVHSFLQQNRFLYVHTPILTTSDCEGAGEMFQVTTLLAEAERRERDAAASPPPSDADVQAKRDAVARQAGDVRLLKEEKRDKGAVKAAADALVALKDELARLELRARQKPGIPRTDTGAIDYGADFFARAAYLTVSGQLQVETYACALTSVYTFGPTFRAENSHTTRHLAEFWMIEPELAFADLQDDMNCAEDLVRFLCQWLLDHCLEDLELLSRLYDKQAVERVRHVAATPFERLSYTEAIDVLRGVTDRKFEKAVEWGIDLGSEHERYLAEVCYKKPVIVYNYPKNIKAFYMRQNEDGKTVAAMDVLVPGVGELVGGSQREERYDVLRQRLDEMGLPVEPYEWYLDLRKYGTVKHAGFGLGFERMVLFTTGIENIRDVIPFPRFPGRADL